jgi:hypothetical protein
MVKIHFSCVEQHVLLNHRVESKGKFITIYDYNKFNKFFEMQHVYVLLVRVIAS